MFAGAGEWKAASGGPAEGGWGRWGERNNTELQDALCRGSASLL